MKHKLLIAVLLIGMSCFSQEVQRKDITALRIQTPIKIDGILDESVYDAASIATDFFQLQPYNGQPSYEKTEIKILFDDDAIYFGAMMYDNPDSIASYITTRDNIGVSDYLLVFLDPNNEGLLSYEFLVTPANSQTDIKGARGNGGDYEDGSWNAVWQSATQILDNGWSAEIRIPYSALRFPAQENPVWGLNFFRRLRRYNSNNSWNLVNNKISGFLHQSGQLHGLKNIKPPVRLSISPYVAQYVENRTEAEKSDFIFKGGLDLKYGVSESHTLDMMLIPDFGQIQSDDEELNLTPFELYYDEKRQFFNEGGELFGRADIFYSRRIGGKPKFSDKAHDELKNNEKVKFNPSSTQMINATKFSGRDKNGLGIGFLNAMTLSSTAQIQDTITGAVRNIVTQPFTNYNVSVIEKTLKNNSYISLINSNVSMVNNPYVANVTATQFQFKNKEQTYQINGVLGGSYKSMADDKTGYGYNVEYRKIKGAFRHSANRSVFSNTIDISDLGYLQRNNIIEHEAQVSYNIFEPFSIFKNWSTQAWLENERLFEPNNSISNEMNYWMDATFKNNWWLGVFYAYNFGTHDFFEPRSSNNRYYVGPAHHISEMNFRTDSNKKLSWYLNTGFYNTIEEERWGNWLNSNIWWKASQRFNIQYDISTQNEINAKGYVDHYNNDSIFFGTYNRKTFVNTVSMSYTFNTKASIEMRARHYWSFANYDDQLFFLLADGTLKPDDCCNESADVNFNAFNIDMTLKWEFAPGSELSVAWKNAIYVENDDVESKLNENLKKTLKADQINNLSVKILYYIDYNSLFNK